jgi:hypothetical protein
MDEALSPLELPGWLEFNAWRTGLTPHRFAFALTPDGPRIRAVLYLDRRGRVKLPPGNAYLPVAFHSARQRRSGRTADWHRVAEPLVEEMRRRGSGNQLYLSPDVQDVRPWQWRGFFVGVRYTYFLDFPLEEASIDRQTRQHRDRAAQRGMTVARVTDVDPVVKCLLDTEARQGFSQGLGQRELREARNLLGDDSLRMYVCFDPAGAPAAARLVLHAPGSRAIAWTIGTTSSGLRNGATPLLAHFSHGDLFKAGATGIDLCGANIPSVAAYKAEWGARLVTNFGVRTYSMRTGARIAADWLKARRL